ncbi:prenylcysteine lyase [Rhizoctonia solani]|uniref:Prenylcysteine lyase n=1 Tax=Rhizoctonia solani TaxID=456999 RepID=A0A8H8NRI4_9AGAM|nr:prenylcysteine lyase [Rhizoctonia solani]QRW17280.1 prenylcysteine lyase [Rhizoctonia solani]
MLFLPALILGPSLLFNEVSATTYKVAIVGAGAGGSSASYWLSLAKQRAPAGTNVEITVYEQDKRVGGRSTTVYPYNNTAYAPIELGASIFTTATETWFGLPPNLDISSLRLVDTADNIRMEERYQDGPTKLGGLIVPFLTSFAKSYTPSFPKFPTVKDYASAVDYTSLLPYTLKSYLTQGGINLNWINDFMTGSTRFNYGQDVGSISAVPGMASLSAAERHFTRTTVNCIEKDKNAKYNVKTNKGTATYDAVIIAAPLPLTNIKFVNTATQPSSFPKVDYLHLHVTLLTTTTPSLLPTYFKANNSSALPGTILTTAEYGSKPQFNSIRYQATIDKNGKTEYVVKIFSPAKISDTTLATLFGKNSIGWVLRKEWDAYPYFPIRSEFPPVKLDKGLYYVNSMEALFSTMETEIISSRNVVDLLSTELIGSGLCGPEGPKGPATDSYVLGWDC